MRAQRCTEIQRAKLSYERILTSDSKYNVCRFPLLINLSLENNILDVASIYGIKRKSTRMNTITQKRDKTLTVFAERRKLAGRLFKINLAEIYFIKTMKFQRCDKFLYVSGGPCSLSALVRNVTHSGYRWNITCETLA